MIKYIWITVAVIVAILALALKQAPKEEPIATESTDQTAAEEQATLPAVSESGNIKVSAPQPESLVSSPLLIKGQARAFESTFQIVLKDGNNKEVAKKTATYTSADPSQFGDYGELLLFDAPGTDQGTLEVFTNSAKDGTVQDLVTIPIKFK